MSGITAGISSLGEKLKEIPSSIVSGLKSFFDNVVSSIESLPSLIINGIKEIFIPDVDDVSNKIDNFSSMLSNKFGLDTSSFENLFKEEKPIVDVKSEYFIAGVGTFNLTFLNASYLVTGIEYFRPYIRAFLILMIFLFNIRSLIGFFGYDAGVVAGRSEHIKSSKESQGE